MVSKKGKPPVRPTATRLIEMHNSISIELETTDLVLESKTDHRGYIKLDRTGLIGHNVTVILGVLKPEDDILRVPKDTIMFSAKVMAGNYVSSLTTEFKELPVTLIVHDVQV